MLRPRCVCIGIGGGKGTPSAEQLETAAVYAAAQSSKKGIHSGLQTIRNVQWSVENLRALVDGAKAEVGLLRSEWLLWFPCFYFYFTPSYIYYSPTKPLDCIVENVRDGCTLRVTLLPGFENVTIALSGIKTPTFKHIGDKDIAEPGAEEALAFTEARLLQRDVKVVLEGVAGQVIFFFDTVVCCI